MGAESDGGDLGGRETNLRAWEKLCGCQPRRFSRSTITETRPGKRCSRGNGFQLLGAAQSPGRELIWSIPLTMKGTPLSDVVRGLRDAEFRFGARAIAESQPTPIIRIGREMNGDWFAWAAAGHEADYIAAYRRVAEIFREALPGFSFDWCANWGPNDIPADLAYPGDDFVDTIGLDVYDRKTDEEPAARWRDDVLNAPYGLAWLDDFARRHAKK